MRNIESRYYYESSMEEWRFPLLPYPGCMLRENRENMNFRKTVMDLE